MSVCFQGSRVCVETHKAKVKCGVKLMETSVCQGRCKMDYERGRFRLTRDKERERAATFDPASFHNLCTVELGNLPGTTRST